MDLANAARMRVFMAKKFKLSAFVCLFLLVGLNAQSAKASSTITLNFSVIPVPAAPPGYYCEDADPTLFATMYGVYVTGGNVVNLSGTFDTPAELCFNSALGSGVEESTIFVGGGGISVSFDPTRVQGVTSISFTGVTTFESNGDGQSTATPVQVVGVGGANTVSGDTVTANLGESLTGASIYPVPVPSYPDSPIISITGIVIQEGPSPSPSPSPSPTLSIAQNSVVVTQAVNNFILSGQSNVTLVQGKSAAILATVTAVNLIPNDQTSMTVTATMPDGTTATSAPIPMASINPTNGTQVTIVPVAVNSSGQGTITLRASSGDAVSSSNVAQTVVVKATNPLGIVYVPISGFFGSITNDSGGTVQQHQTMSNAFMQGAFPVAEGGIQSQIYSEILQGTVAANQTSEMSSDLLNAFLIGTRLSPQARNSIGIVPQLYFSEHSYDARGITFKVPSPALPPPVSLITNGYWMGTAHEIGHTYGFGDLSELTTVNGFWVDQNLPVSGAIDLMFGQSAILQGFSIPAFSIPQLISSSEYSTIFQSQLITPGDPQVMVVAGTLSQSGAVTLQPTFFLSNGIATPFSSSANGAVQSIDSSGAIVAQASFNSSFTLVDDQGVEIPTNTGIFLVQLPFSQSADTIQINQNGKTLTSFNPNAQLLLDTVKEIPNTSFVRDSKLEEQVFVDEAQSIDSIITLCSKIQTKTNFDNWEKVVCNDQPVELLLGFRHQLDLGLNDSTATTSTLQVTKTEVLNVVDMIALQLLGNVTIQTSGHPFTIRVLPGDSQGILSIVSVTQGTTGSVYINKDGTILYKPNGATPKADIFTVTLQDTEGATVTRTISIVLPCIDDGRITRWTNRFAQ
jgi:hypothetical protein